MRTLGGSIQAFIVGWFCTETDTDDGSVQREQTTSAAPVDRLTRDLDVRRAEVFVQ